MLQWPRSGGKWRGATVAIGVDADGLAWRLSGARGADQAAVSCSKVPTALGELLLRCKRAEVVSATDITVYWIQRPPAGVRSLSELRAAAAARCSKMFGGRPEDWWIAADWDATRPFACAGLPMRRVAPLREQLSAAGVAARWHAGWSLVCNRAAREIPEEGWVGWRSPAAAIVWHCSSGRATHVQTFRLRAEGASAQFLAAVAAHQRAESVHDATVKAGPVTWLRDPETGDGASEACSALALV